MADLIPNSDDQILIRNCDDDELICPYPEIPEPHKLLKLFGYIPPQLARSIDVFAPLFPLSACIEYADDWGHSHDENDKPLTADQCENAKKYWVFYRRMAEYYKRVDYFNNNPTEYYLWLVKSTKGSLAEELASHWEEV